MRSKIECTLADLGVVTKINFEDTVETWLAYWKSRKQSHIVKTVDSTLKDVFQESYFNSNSRLQTVMINVVEQGLGERIWYGRFPTVLEAQMRGLVQSNSVVDIILQATLSNTGLMVPIAEKVVKLVDRDFDQYHLSNIEEALKTNPAAGLFEELP